MVSTKYLNSDASRRRVAGILRFPFYAVALPLLLVGAGLEWVGEAAAKIAWIGAPDGE